METTPSVDSERRRFLVSGAGLVFGIPLVTRLAGCSPGGDGGDDSRAAATGAPTAPSTGSLDTLYVRINSDDTITILSPAAEMGNGSSTALPVILAEEMDADWSKVDIEFSPSDDALYGNPNPFFHGIMLTAGSSAVAGYYDIMRLNGAQIRKVLLQAAATDLGVPFEELATEPGVVVHESSGRHLTYGEIAAVAEVPEPLPEVDSSELKNPSDFRLIGDAGLHRWDTPSKVRAEPVYSIDIQLPDMLYATMRRPFLANRFPISVNDSAVMALPDVVAVDRFDDSVAVVARTMEAALKAEKALEVIWSRAEEDALFTSDAQLAALEATARDTSIAGMDVLAMMGQPGTEAENALNAADRVFERVYKTDYTYHAQIEPLNAVARVSENGSGVEIWAGTQTPTHCVRSVAAALEIDPAGVTLHRTHLGGGFGRRAAQDHDWAVDAARLSQRHQAPVKTIWSREADVGAGRFRPMSAQMVRATITDDARVGAYHQRVVSDEALRWSDPFRYERGRQFPVISAVGLFEQLYAYDAYKAEFILAPSDVRVSPMRGIGKMATTFARESFIDEIAAELGKDPLDFRQEMTGGNARAQEVLSQLRARCNWDGRPVLGCALSDERFAVAVEIDLDRDRGIITPRQIWAVIDPGIVIHPNNAEQMLVGGFALHLGTTLRERITISNGQVDQSNFHQYQVTSMRDLPPIDIEFVEALDEPQGLGDFGTEAVTAAIANAFFTVTHQRLRHLPFSPGRVLETLGAQTP